MASQNRNLKLTIKDVRCFSGEQHFDIRPLTFLIGANSTGKTTVMSCFSTIYNFISKGTLHALDFNKEPYYMGYFIDIVRKSKAGKVKTNIQNFEIGISHKDIKYHFCFQEKQGKAEPFITQAQAGVKKLSFFCGEKEKKIILTITDNKSNKEKKLFSFGNNIYPAFPIVDPYIPQTNRHNKIDPLYKELQLLQSWKRKLFKESIFSLAPNYSKPQRIYDTITEPLSSDEDENEIPVYLYKLKQNPSDWEKIHKYLINFGKASGLFSDIKVRQFGTTKEAYFQLQFKIRGVESNIIDTGYGLSQILPLLVQIFLSNIPITTGGTRFLLQQPEVHLHPEAQAELASLFVKSANLNNAFLVETHSDYMLDRTRMEIRKGEIASDQVSIIYFEPVKEGVKAHNISIDEQGNLIGVPIGYRNFFIKDTDRL